MAAAGGHVTVRVNTPMLILSGPNGDRFDLMTAARSLEGPGEVGSWAVTIVNGGRSIPGRLCALRKSEAAARLAQEKARQIANRKGKKLRPQTLEYAKYVILFTTFPQADFPAEDVLEWYRLRWQVELVFKRFKSLARIGHLPKHDDDSAKAWLYGKLFTALLVEKLIAHATAVSPWGYELARPAPAQRVA